MKKKIYKIKNIHGTWIRCFIYLDPKRSVINTPLAAVQMEVLRYFTVDRGSSHANLNYDYA